VISDSYFQREPVNVRGPPCYCSAIKAPTA
jgi:hypothetical protein